MEPIIVRKSESTKVKWPGGGEGWVLASPSLCATAFLYAGIEYVKPGESPHRWHSHDYDKGDKFEVIYPKDFEEVYIIIEGQGILYYDVDGRKVHKKVDEGDAVFFPHGMAKHELVNTGTKTMILVFAGAPPPTIREA